ncbi:hypothetical protein SCUCBS95973_000189 [Sporothrix curviconia]|uniref:alpha-1,2-Mannosidase n=1 Tax=Sporothrix curviconia TaxID=1260050 RepID=A0ABP0AN77_9PEZI
MAFLRFRRYRVYVFAALLLLFLIFRLSHNSELGAHHTTIYKGYTAPSDESSTDANSNADAGARPDVAFPKVDVSKVGAVANEPIANDPKPVAQVAAAPAGQPVQLPQLHTSLEIKGHYGIPTGPRSIEPAAPQQTIATEPPPPPPPQADDAFDSHRVQQADALAAAQETAMPVAGAPVAITQPIYSTSVIHWMKMADHFPIPEESLILLPTGKPKPIPRIQHKFKSESSEAREVRESRLASVRSEMQHAWTGYRTYAWTHDELTPNSKSFRDPFCGWAASLVDALDTLWIMKMYDEFDEAYEAVKQIDFTTTPFRNEIPVFETIIRYLGGLVAAYDISGGANGKYPELLTKAVELAEILMGVFDTPNRMPILYYSWKPTYFSQPKTASTFVSVAELGSMSMEFTRLAQLTGHNKYYDAIARITDAFEEWQNRPNGTAIPGIFPEHIDASGCNRTAAILAENENASRLAKAQMAAAAAAAAAASNTVAEPVGYQPSQPASDPMQAQDKVEIGKTLPPDLEFKVNPATGPGKPGTGEFHKVNPEDLPAGTTHADSLKKRDLSDAPAAEEPPAAVAPEANAAPIAQSGFGSGSGSGAHKANAPLAADGQAANFVCIPQNLTSGGYGMESYGMGGSQDSTYEYFPKQYLLLGGLVPKYQAMHEKVSDAVKSHLLYRPMIKDDRDILFSAKVSSRDGTSKELVYNYEITHLTCFLGGMFAMGGRIFDRPEDIEIGAKLADGCAWAYEAMPMGVMPEGSAITPCANMTSCPWNETAWFEQLDPNGAWRDKEVLQYEQRMQTWTKKKNEIEQLKKARKEEEEREREAAESARLAATAAAAAAATVPAASVAEAPVVATPSIGKRDAIAGGETEVTAADVEAINAKEKVLQNELDLNAAGSDGRASAAAAAAAAAPPTAAPAVAQKQNPPKAQKPLPAADLILPPMPNRPMSHSDFVHGRIERDKLQPGFTLINDRRYILRPEAIESVWYMYRITGDPSWQEKGWRMFQAVIRASRTEYGHSAIDDVTADPNQPITQLDNMESFWFAETLKYFYLLFTTPDVISLDDYVLNTEAHPFKRPT